MKKEILSFEIGSVIKIFFFMGLILGLILGILFAITYSIVGIFGHNMYPDVFQNVPRNTGALVGLIGIIVFPLVYAILGAIFGLILTGFYNIVSRAVGGIKIDIKE